MGRGTFATPRIGFAVQGDGSARMWSQEPLAPHRRTLADLVTDGAGAHPDRLLVAERAGTGWRSLTWAEAAARTQLLAQGLLDRGAGDRPVMVLSGNGVDHLLMTLAAYTIGVPVAPVSAAY